MNTTNHIKLFPENISYSISYHSESWGQVVRLEMFPLRPATRSVSISQFVPSISSSSLIPLSFFRLISATPLKYKNLNINK